MGFAGLMWLSSRVEKLKVLRSMTTDDKQKAIIDEMIADFENKVKEAE